MLLSEYPKWLVFQLAEACNLRCRMCYEWGDHGSYHHQGKPARLEFEAICRTLEACAPGRPYVELFGGEPFLHPRIAEVIGRVGEAGSVLGIPTNGTLLTRHADALVGEAPIRLWVSLDGPEAVNDRQRGRGVFRRAVEGLETLYDVREARGARFPQLGITYIVTPDNCGEVEELFLRGIELSKLDFISIVMQNFATAAEVEAYEAIVTGKFGGHAATHARGYLQQTSHFSGMDLAGLAAQIDRVRAACREKETLFFSNPMTTDERNLRSFFAAEWSDLTDHRTRCAFPWMYAEVSARGEVTTCHSFYDITVGNIYEESFLDIWKGERIRRVREHLRGGLFPICTACCRYYNNPTSAVLDGQEAARGSVSFGEARPGGRDG